MQYTDTFGNVKGLHFLDTVLMGLATGGGLIVPEEYPQYSETDLTTMSKMNYQTLAYCFINDISDDIPSLDLEKIITKTYNTDNFNTKEIVPLDNIGTDLYLADLSTGPSLAFKDIALQLLGNLFEYTLEKKNDFINVLGASSGDTVTAAEVALMNKNNTTITMLTPYQRMSPFQEAMTYSIIADNVNNLAGQIPFDPLQTIVKSVTKDDEFKKKYHIGAVNSINWARIAAQVVYYFKGYFDAIKKSGKKVGDLVDYSIPTGNFGDIHAGHIAKQCGLPIGRLNLATNENRVLHDFIQTGNYAPWDKDDVHVTSSPSMDIADASNIWRMFFDAVGRRPGAIRAMDTYVKKMGHFSFENTPIMNTIRNEYGFDSGFSTHPNRMDTIRSVYSMTPQHASGQLEGRLIDTHTADAAYVGMQKKRQGVPMVILETAKPAKFEDAITEAVGFKPPIPESYKDVFDREMRVTVLDKGSMEENIAQVRKYMEKNLPVQPMKWAV